MKEFKCDILIIGSGLTGLVSAYVLSLLGFKIIIAEQKKAKKNQKLLKDIRTTAIAEGSKNFLDQIGLWKKISKFSEKIKYIEVIDREKTNKINFSNSAKNNNLGYVVKNLKLTKVINQALIKKNNVILNYDSKLLTVEYLPDKIIGIFENKKIISKILLAADGKNSTVRQKLNTPVFNKKYKEDAFVMNFFHTQKHNNTAYEFFYKNGPLAILPMQSENINFQSSIIWSNDKKYLSSLVVQNDKIIKEILEEKIGGVVGKIKKINSKQIFSLSSHINDKFYEKRVLYIGDSAHSIHPIAGQGWNLGLRDIKNLYNLAKETNMLGISIGSKQFCIDYNEKCYYDAFQLYQITDKLNLVFKNNSLLLNQLRPFGFNLIEKNSFLKKQITEFAMGFN